MESFGRAHDGRVPTPVIELTVVVLTDADAVGALMVPDGV